MFHALKNKMPDGFPAHPLNFRLSGDNGALPGFHDSRNEYVKNPMVAEFPGLPASIIADLQKFMMEQD